MRIKEKLPANVKPKKILSLRVPKELSTEIASILSDIFVTPLDSEIRLAKDFCSPNLSERKLTWQN